MADIHYDFRLYIGTSKKTSAPSVTIRKQGKIALNVAAFELLNSPGFVTLSFDSKRRAIGIEPCSPDARGHCRVSVSQDNRLHDIAARAFLRDHDLEHSSSKRYPARMYRDYLVIDVDGPSEDAATTGKMKSRDLRALDSMREHDHEA